MTNDDQQLLFAKQLADNSEFANESGLRSLLQIIKTGSETVVNGPPPFRLGENEIHQFPGAFDAWKTLVEDRPDLFSDSFRQELKELATPPKPQRIAVGQCQKCSRELRFRPSLGRGISRQVRITCKCGHHNALLLDDTAWHSAVRESSPREGYGEKAAIYALKFLPPAYGLAGKRQRPPQPAVNLSAPRSGASSTKKWWQFWRKVPDKSTP